MTAVHYTIDNDIEIVVLSSPVQLLPIVRTSESLMSDTVKTIVHQSTLDAVINAVWYDLTTSGIVGAKTGGRPISASETINQGLFCFNGQAYGRSSPSMHFLAQDRKYKFFTGVGECPSGYSASIAGLAPLIVQGLRYGATNVYSKKLENAIMAGEPKPEHKQYLTQRSSKKFEQINGNKAKGKMGIGVLPNNGIVLLAQPHNPPSGGQDYYFFRDKFIEYGCQTAFFLDGSDSVFLNYKGTFILKAAEDKDQTQTFAVGFKSWGK